MKRCSEKCSKFTGEHLYVVVGVGGGGGESGVICEGGGSSVLKWGVVT